VLVQGDLSTEVAWAPQPGSQQAVLSCPVFECLIEGNRGGGKTDVFLFSFLQHVGKGWGAEWRGILFRRTYPELRDVIDKCLKWIPRIWPEARYNRSEHYWIWPGGEQLFLRHLARESDYWSYHGHNYPWMGFEELCTWPDDKAYTKMFACARSSVPGIPIMVRATANPYGVGHNWVKRRFGLPLPPGRVKGPVMRNLRHKNGDLLPERVAIHSSLDENLTLLKADPNYLSRIKAAARNDAEYQAWVHGNWDIVAGGMFDDVWDPAVHVLPNFPLDQIPRRWYINRSYDHGSSRPFSVGWWAESNGEPLHYNGRVYGPVPGDRIRVAEWYGWNGQPNEGLLMRPSAIGRGIVDREKDWGLAGRVRTGPADSSIFDPTPGHPNVAADMLHAGVSWEPSDKAPGSRVQGWQQIREMLAAAAEQPREEPGLFVLERCEHFRRTVPVLPRSNRDPDDVNSDAEDHVGDETRYQLRHWRREVQTGAFK
jgi:hypothetical protein